MVFINCLQNNLCYAGSTVHPIHIISVVASLTAEASHLLVIPESSFALEVCVFPHLSGAVQHECNHVFL